jgi:hypothetical protein
MKRIQQQETPNSISTFCLVGCKLDLLENHTDDPILAEATQIVESQGCAFFAATSAKNKDLGTPIQEVFLRAALLKMKSGSRRYLKPPAWIPDAERKKCNRCEIQFNAIHRRHHCRNCGEVYCKPCCSIFKPLERFGIFTDVRICVECNELISEK